MGLASSQNCHATVTPASDAAAMATADGTLSNEEFT